MSNQQQQNSSMADAYVLPFEQLRMTDVESVGGKNASLGEMISQLSSTGVRANWLCDYCIGISRFSETQ
jgi:pyruvate,water dikinase